MVEGEGAFRRDRRFEGDVETEKIHQWMDWAIQVVGTQGNNPLELLTKLLREIPQRKNHVLQYLVTSGIAVALLCNTPPRNHDLDLVIMNKTSPVGWEVYGTDNVTPEKYWADMYLSADFLEATAKITRGVEIVHPAIIMVQKSSDAWGRQPRDKDREDVDKLAIYLRDIEPNPRSWNPILQEAVLSLPQKEQRKTISRLNRSFM